MDLVKELYEIARAERPRSEAVKEMEASIYQMAKEINSVDEKENQAMTDLLFEASLHGEIAGFRLGFHAILTLVAQSYLL